jgi:hypothetical protein
VLGGNHDYGALMTEFRLPPLVVDYSQLWLEADVRGDDKAWPWRSAAQLLARPRWAAYRTPADEKRLTELLRQAAVVAREYGKSASMGFMLVPSPDEGIKGVANFSPVDLVGRDTAEAWDDLLEQLAPEIPGDYPREVTTMQTKAGECRRLRLRYAAGDEGPERPVGEHIRYLWVFADYGAAIVMSISFLSLLESARWLPALDELAAGVWLQRYPGEGESE